MSGSGKHVLGQGAMRSGEPILRLSVQKGTSYLLLRAGSEMVPLPFAPITGTRALQIQATWQSTNRKGANHEAFVPRLDVSPLTTDSFPGATPQDVAVES